MTPERRAYAEKRISRLTAKKNGLIASIRTYGSRTVTDAECREAEALLKALRSCNTSIKRWQKELGNDSSH